MQTYLCNVGLLSETRCRPSVISAIQPPEGISVLIKVIFSPLNLFCSFCSFQNLWIQVIKALVLCLNYHLNSGVPKPVMRPDFLFPPGDSKYTIPDGAGPSIDLPWYLDITKWQDDCQSIARIHITCIASSVRHSHCHSLQSMHAALSEIRRETFRLCRH